MSIGPSQPIRDALVDKAGFLVRSWRNYFFALQGVGQASPQVLQTASPSTQTAAIPPTPLPLPSISSGYYRVNVYETITLPAGVSSSLQVTIGWTDNGTASTRALSALTTNTIGANDSTTFPIHVDNNSPITYAVAYASNPASTMTYNIGVLLEALA